MPPKENQPEGRVCPFCTTGEIYSDTMVSVRYDRYPVTEGHMLVTPNRHVSSLLELSDVEYAQMFKTGLDMIREHDMRLGRKLDEQSWNIGVNIGKNAGQTVPHAHIHLIPRAAKDVKDPKGGVRWVVPLRAKYWD